MKRLCFYIQGCSLQEDTEVKKIINTKILMAEHYYNFGKVVISVSILQKQVIQSLDGLSEDNLQFLFDMIQCFMKPDEIEKNNNEKSETVRNVMQRIGSLEGQDLIDADYDIDACNDEIAEMFGVNDL